MNLMSWKRCERQFIRKIKIDLEMVESIKETSLFRLNRARSTKVNSESISLIVADYYEVVKELLVAYLLKNGLRSKNHQCLISYFYKQNPELEREALLIQQMSFFRNRLGYYGEKVPVKFYEDRKKEFEDLIKILLRLLK